jgi:hypothetical protein
LVPHPWLRSGLPLIDAFAGKRYRMNARKKNEVLTSRTPI